MYEHRIRCPGCGHETRAAFGGADDPTGVGESFTCPGCQKPVAISLADRVEAIARRRAMRPMKVLFPLLCATGVAVAIKLIIRTGFTASGPSLWVTSIAVGILLGWMVSLVLLEFRRERVRDALWQDAEARGAARPPPGTAPPGN